VASALACLAVGAGLREWWSAVRDRSANQIVAFSIDLPADSLRVDIPLSIARDGSRVVYGALRNGREQLFVRFLDRDDEVALVGTDDAEQPAFSPDGKEIVFAAAGKLKRTAIAGGVPAVLADVPNPEGIAWGPDGYIVYAPDAGSGLFRISPGGGTPEVVTRVDGRYHQSHGWPQVLPGRVILFADWYGTSAGARIVAESLDTGQQEIVITDGWKAQYVSSGHVVYVNNRGEIFAVPFDPTRLAVTGAAVPLPERPATGTADDVSFFVSSGGTLAYVPFEAPRRLKVVVNWQEELKQRVATR
jgi:Tol biopolymer transport system component